MFQKIQIKFTSLIISLLIVSTGQTQFFSLRQENSVQVLENNDTLLNPWTGGFNSAQFSKIDLNNDQIEDLAKCMDPKLGYLYFSTKFAYITLFPDISWANALSGITSLTLVT